MAQIVVLDRHPLRVPLRPPAFPHQWREYAHTRPEQIIDHLHGATVAVTGRVPLDAAALVSAPTLRLVAVSATGCDHIDLAACAAQGITVCNVRDWSVSVPEHVFALTLALRRKLFEYRAALEDGAWERSPTYGVLFDPLPRALAGGTMGLIGYGALARRVETIAQAFGMTVLVAERKGAAQTRAGRTPFDETLGRCDVLTVLCPLTDETRGMIGDTELALMCPDALLVNCGRGGIVDEASLAAALKEGRIGGAGTDVLAEEPPRSGSPLLDLRLPNLIVTPHMAWASLESLEMLAEQLIGNIEAFVSGQPRNLVLAKQPSL